MIEQRESIPGGRFMVLISDIDTETTTRMVERIETIPEEGEESWRE